MSSVNYAKSSGYESLPASIVFAVLYAPLFLWFIFKSFTRPTYVNFILCLFCLIRISAFVIRAILIAVDDAGTNFGVVVADQVLFGVGYFGLLYSAYILVLNLVEVVNATNKPQGMEFGQESPINKIMQNRHLFRLLLSVAVALGVASSSMLQKDGTSPSKAITLREASTIIFLVMTALLFLQTVQFARLKMAGPRESAIKPHQKSFGEKHGIFILVGISLLLLVREVFTTATMMPNNHAKQANEHFWYPLVVIPEIMAVACFLSPGLIISSKQIREEKTLQDDRDLENAKRGHDAQ